MKRKALSRRLAYLMVQVLALIGSGSGQSVEDCGLGIQIHNSLQECGDSPPIVSGTIYGDGACRTVQTTASPNDPNYNLLPGNYQAQCVNSTHIRFVQSGCVSSFCEGSGDTCFVDRTQASHLYAQAFSNPIFRLSTATRRYCYHGSATYSFGQEFRINFAIVGDCKVCNVATHPPVAIPTLPPTPQTTASPTRVPTLRPTIVPTAPPTNRPTRAPTAPPTSVPTAPPTNRPTTTSPTVQPTNVPTALPTNRPTRAPTVRLTNVPKLTAAPTESPTVQPTNAETNWPTPISTIAPTQPTILELVTTEPLGFTTAPTLPERGEIKEQLGKEEPSGHPPQDSSTGIITGSCIGAAVLLSILGALIYFRGRIKHKIPVEPVVSDTTRETKPPSPNETTTTTPAGPTGEMVVVIDTTETDDISTLEGCSVCRGSRRKDDPTAPVSLPYDYLRERLGRNLTDLEELELLRSPPMTTNAEQRVSNNNNNDTFFAVGDETSFDKLYREV